MLITSSVDIKQRQALDIRSGDTIRVTQKIIEKDKKTGKPKTRFQDFEGMVLSVKHGKEAGGTVTVRKVASGVGVERIFPVYSPMVEKIEVIKRSRVRQAKLYHIREKAAKEIKRQMRNVQTLPEEPEESTPPPAPSSSDEGENREDEEVVEEVEKETEPQELKKEEA